MTIRETHSFGISDQGHSYPDDHWGEILIDILTLHFEDMHFTRMSVIGRPINRETVQVTKTFEGMRNVPDWALPWTAYHSWEIALSE